MLGVCGVASLVEYTRDLIFAFLFPKCSSDVMAKIFSFILKDESSL